MNVRKFYSRDDYFINNEGNILSLGLLNETYTKDYIFQETLVRHTFFSLLNESSVNTIKVVTFTDPSSNETLVFHAALRIGALGQTTDNQTSGGVAIGIYPNGQLYNFAVLYDGERVNEFNGINLIDTQRTIPCFEEIKETAISIAKKTIHHRILTLDMMLDSESKVRCIEVNTSGNGIELFQTTIGPLFGSYTDIVLKYCKANKSKLFLNYSL